MERSEILKQFGNDDENLINILHALQNNNSQNYLEKDDLKAAANHLNITYSHIYGVVTYYTMFSLKPRGKNIIRICNSPVCDMEKSSDIITKIKKILSIGVGEISKDKRFSLELSECLGQCDIAPGMMINEDVYGNLHNADLASIFEKYK
ncbi:MAG: NAD(P)H-dependent oxidoreductase subunit E [Bacteroidales bacterium]|jgi:NADH-quinone oxidoreductase subunit E|nr:NAD(P)H-dependent oxidoreductase subunit E [Bacteroidales bacterium]